jgi:hypothetical protein
LAFVSKPVGGAIPFWVKAMEVDVRESLIANLPWFTASDLVVTSLL